MTPKLPDLLIADLLVDPSRNVLARERAGDSVEFSNVLDAARGAAAKGAEAQEDRRSDTRAGTRAKASDSVASNKARSSVDVEARLAHQRESRRTEDSDLASEKALQAHSAARARGRAEDRIRAEGITRDEARVAAKSSDQEAGRAALSRAEGPTEISATKNEPEVDQAGDQDDGSHPESRLDGGGSGQQASAEDTSATSAGAELAAESAIVAGAIAATLSVAAAPVGSVDIVVSPRAESTALVAVGSIQSSGSVGATGDSGVAEAPATPSESAVSESSVDSEVSAWGAMSSARAGSAAGGIDQMARQLGLLRSIQSAGVAADSARVAQQALAQRGSSSVAEGVNALPATSSNPTEGQVSGGVSAQGVTTTNESAPLNGPTQVGVSTSTSVSSSATISTGNPSADPSVDLSPAASLSSNMVSQLSATPWSGGLFSAEFVPGVSVKGGTDPAPGGLQTALDPSGVANSQFGISVIDAPDVAQGFAQVARAFDQASAATQARIARGASQKQSQTASAVSPLSGPATASPDEVVGTPKLSASDLMTSAGLLQATQAAGQSVGVIATAGLALGGSGRVGGSGFSGEPSLGGFRDVASEGGVVSSVIGSIASGAGNQPGPGPDSGGRSVPDSFSGIESGDGAVAKGQRSGGATLGAAASAQSAVGPTFGSVLGAANGSIGNSSQEAAAPAGAASASSAVSSAGVTGVLAADGAVSGLPGSGVTSAITPQAIGGSLRLDASGPATVQSPLTADQLPVALDQTAIDLARLRGGMLTLELAPADLGRLSFEMRIDDSGAAFVAIRLEDDTVRALVENAAGALRDSLSREGFKLDSFTVSSGFGSPEQRENSQNQAFAETSNRRAQPSGSPEVSSESVRSRASNTQVRPGTSSLSLFA